MLKTQQPVCKLTLAPTSDQRGVALIFSMSHIAADGATYYAILNQLSSDGQVTAANPGQIDLESIGYDHGAVEDTDWRLIALTWLMVVLCGMLIGAIGFILTQIQFAMTAFKINTSEEVQRESGVLLGSLTFIAISCAMVGFAGFMVVFVGPVAAGSGIPFLVAYLNGNAVPNFLSVRTYVWGGFGGNMSLVSRAWCIVSRG